MNKKLFLVLLCSLLVVPFSPVAGWSHHHYGDAALAWGLTGLFLGATLATLAVPPPVVYAAPTPTHRPPVTTHAPAVPPGMCRWERYVLDGHGRTVPDRFGRPLKEYTLGSCHTPPD